MKVYRKYSVKGIVDGQEKAEVIYTVYHTPIRSKNQLEFSFMSE